MFSNDTTRSALVLKQAWRQQLRRPQIVRQLETAWTAAEKDGGRRRARAEETGGARGCQGRELGPASQDGERGMGAWGWGTKAGRRGAE